MQSQARNGAVKLCVTKGEAPPSEGVEPVATIVFGRHDADDGSLQDEAPRRAVKLSCTEGKDPAVDSVEPIAVGWRRAGVGQYIIAEHTA